jgi:hypothetical protein
MEMKFKSVLWFITAALLIGCNDSDSDSNSDSDGLYDDGFIVINEGNMSGGTLSYVDENFTVTTNDLYASVNAGDGLGAFVQSVFEEDERVFIVSNGSNVITVVNEDDFTLIDKIDTNLAVPRYGVVYNNRIFVTNQNSFLTTTDDYVAVFDANTYAHITNINLNDAADRIMEENGKIIVANGAFGVGNGITVINPQTNTITAQIPTAVAPNTIDEENGFLYVLCSNFADPSQLVKIDLATNAVVSTIVFPENMVNCANLTIENNALYFTQNQKVYRFPLTATEVVDVPLFTSQATVLYGFAVEDNRIYVADAEDYQSAGTVFVHDSSGNLTNTLTVGLIPNGFFFVD